MKCKICGHRTTTLNAMRKHYQQKHPEAMKRRKQKTLVSMRREMRPYEVHTESHRYCPYCGSRL